MVVLCTNEQRWLGKGNFNHSTTACTHLQPRALVESRMLPVKETTLKSYSSCIISSYSFMPLNSPTCSEQLSLIFPVALECTYSCNCLDVSVCNIRRNLRCCSSQGRPSNLMLFILQTAFSVCVLIGFVNSVAKVKGLHGMQPVSNNHAPLNLRTRLHLRCQCTIARIIRPFRVMQNISYANV